MCSPSDEPLVTPLRAQFSDLQVYRIDELLFEPPPLRAGDCLVTSRFHPHLLASRAGLSGYYVATSAFYRAKHASVLALGSTFQELTGAAAAPQRELAPQAKEADRLRRATKSAVAQKVFDLATLAPRAARFGAGRMVLSRLRNRLRRAKARVLLQWERHRSVTQRALTASKVRRPQGDPGET